MSGAIETVEKKLEPELIKLLTDIIDASGTAAAKRLKKIKAAIRAADTGWAFDKTNPAAVKWIKDHAADTINGISNTTREDIKDLVEAAFTEQYDVDELADKIADLIGDDARAETIARTETMRASNEGQSQAWDQAVEVGILTGDEKQVWIVTPDDRLCPICEPMDGETAPLDGSFNVDGDDIDGPPAHPNCRCTVALEV